MKERPFYLRKDFDSNLATATDKELDDLINSTEIMKLCCRLPRRIITAALLFRKYPMKELHLQKELIYLFEEDKIFEEESQINLKDLLIQHAQEFEYAEPPPLAPKHHKQKITEILISITQLNDDEKYNTSTYSSDSSLSQLSSTDYHDNSLSYYFFKAIDEPSEEIRLDRFRDNVKMESSKFIKVEDLFKENDYRHLFIQGQAGVGKTTICKYMLYKWSQNNLWFGKFDYLYYIPLRNIIQYHNNPVIYTSNQKVLTLIDVIVMTCFGFGSRKHHLTESQVYTLRNDINQSLKLKKCIILLDGFDEIAHLFNSSHNNNNNNNNNSNNSMIQHILIDAFQQYVILTSRPYSMSTALNYFNFGNPCKLWNCGFTGEQIRHYINSYFDFTVIKTKNTSADQMLKFLVADTYLWGAAHVPLVTGLLCGLWQHNPEHLSNATTITTVYTRIMDLLKSREVEKMLKDFDIDKEYDIRIEGLAFLAHKALTDSESNNTGLFNGSIMKNDYYFKLLAEKYDKIKNKNIGSSSSYSNTTLSINVNDKGKNKIISNYIKSILDVGILHTIEDQTKNGTIYDLTYEFMHLSFQEYLVAVHLANGLSMKESNVHRYSKVVNFIKEQKYNPIYSIVFRFVSGLLYLHAEATDMIDALNLFWDLIINQPPFDLIGEQHICLVIDCLEQGEGDRLNLIDKSTRDTIFKLIDEWFFLYLNTVEKFDSKSFLNCWYRSPSVMKSLQFYCSFSSKVKKVWLEQYQIHPTKLTQEKLHLIFSVSAVDGDLFKSLIDQMENNEETYLCNQIVQSLSYFLSQNNCPPPSTFPQRTSKFPHDLIDLLFKLYLTGKWNKKYIINSISLFAKNDPKITDYVMKQIIESNKHFSNLRGWRSAIEEISLFMSETVRIEFLTFLLENATKSPFTLSDNLQLFHHLAKQPSDGKTKDKIINLYYDIHRLHPHLNQEDLNDFYLNQPDLLSKDQLRTLIEKELDREIELCKDDDVDHIPLPLEKILLSSLISKQSITEDQVDKVLKAMFVCYEPFQSAYEIIVVNLEGEWSCFTNTNPSVKLSIISGKEKKALSRRFSDNTYTLFIFLGSRITIGMWYEKYRIWLEENKKILRHKWNNKILNGIIVSSMVEESIMVDTVLNFIEKGDSERSLTSIIYRSSNSVLSDNDPINVIVKRIIKNVHEEAFKVQKLSFIKLLHQICNNSTLKEYLSNSFVKISKVVSNIDKWAIARCLVELIPQLNNTTTSHLLSTVLLPLIKDVNENPWTKSYAAFSILQISLLTQSPNGMQDEMKESMDLIRRQLKHQSSSEYFHSEKFEVLEKSYFAIQLGKRIIIPNDQLNNGNLIITAFTEGVQIEADSKYGPEYYECFLGLSHLCRNHPPLAISIVQNILDQLSNPSITAAEFHSLIRPLTDTVTEFPHSFKRPLTENQIRIPIHQSHNFKVKGLIKNRLSNRIDLNSQLIRACVKCLRILDLNSTNQKCDDYELIDIVVERLLASSSLLIKDEDQAHDHERVLLNYLVHKKMNALSADTIYNILDTNLKNSSTNDDLQHIVYSLYQLASHNPEVREKVCKSLFAGFSDSRAYCLRALMQLLKDHLSLTSIMLPVIVSANMFDPKYFDYVSPISKFFRLYQSTKELIEQILLLDDLSAMYLLPILIARRESLLVSPDKTDVLSIYANRGLTNITIDKSRLEYFIMGVRLYASSPYGKEMKKVPWFKAEQSINNERKISQR